jgi:putative flippase GtrA
MIEAMSDLERRSGSRPSRRQREQRAFTYVVVGGGAAVVFVVGAILAILTSFPGWIAVLAAVVAVLCAVMFRRAIR